MNEPNVTWVVLLHRTWSFSGIGAFSECFLRWKPLRSPCEVLLRFYGRYDGEVGQSNQNKEVSGRKLVSRSDVSMYSSTLCERYPFLLQYVIWLWSWEVVLNLFIQSFREATNQFRDRCHHFVPEISWNGDWHELTVVVCTRYIIPSSNEIRRSKLQTQQDVLEFNCVNWTQQKDVSYKIHGRFAMI